MQRRVSDSQPRVPSVRKRYALIESPFGITLLFNLQYPDPAAASVCALQLVYWNELLPLNLPLLQVRVCEIHDA